MVTQSMLGTHVANMPFRMKKKIQFVPALGLTKCPKLTKQQMLLLTIERRTCPPFFVEIKTLMRHDTYV